MCHPLAGHDPEGDGVGEDDGMDGGKKEDDQTRKLREGLIFEAGDPPSSIFVVLKGHLQARAPAQH